MLQNPIPSEFYHEKVITYRNIQHTRSTNGEPDHLSEIFYTWTLRKKIAETILIIKTTPRGPRFRFSCRFYYSVAVESPFLFECCCGVMGIRNETVRSKQIVRRTDDLSRSRLRSNFTFRDLRPHHLEAGGGRGKKVR